MRLSLMLQLTWERFEMIGWPLAGVGNDASARTSELANFRGATANGGTVRKFQD
jgi:hypothetical protein